MIPGTKNKQGLHKNSLNPTVRSRLRTKLLIRIVVIIYFLLNMCHLPDIVNRYDCEIKDYSRIGKPSKRNKY